METLYLSRIIVYFKNDTLISNIYIFVSVAINDRANDLVLRFQQYIYQKELHLQWAAPSGQS